MREILFRGKRIRPDNDTGKIEWVYGLYMTVYGTPNIELEDGRECDVDAETVGQYTGLTDKNGTQVFEGDILKSKEYGRQQGDKNFSGYDIFEVRFVDGAYVIRNSDRLFYLLRGADKEVIGNIYDNPELLEVESNGV